MPVGSVLPSVSMIGEENEEGANPASLLAHVSALRLGSS
jgi:hypothetical protein